MPATHPFRFGVQASSAVDAADWSDIAKQAEDLGFSTLFMPDHFGDQFAPIPALMAVADATTTLRIGGLVLDNDYKHPVVLAKELATLDVLSGGRTEIGLGAGWMIEDYEQSGIAHDPPGVRIDRMVEGLAVIKGLMADGAFDFAGDHYSISGLDGRPKPLQRPHPPILIGAGGKRMLSIAAREADIVGINPNLRSGRIDAETAGDAVAAAYDQKVEWVRDAAGPRFESLELNCLMFFVNLTDDSKGFAESMAPVFGLSPDEVLDVPAALFGTVDEMCERLLARRERWGLSYIVCQKEAMADMAPVVAKLTGT
jgi:probable F420-dependent oxidoreductase